MAEREEHINLIQFSEQEARIKKVNRHPITLKFDNLDLQTGCKNSIMGGPFLRGVSGGERKRVSIGVLASEGHRTVLLSIHQPSSKLFYMFHKILLLSDGNPLYFGKGNETMEYFY
ncbi:hypothetical protein C5167_019803 [Papaver somniferum]|uniref:ABC transporter domain-containing protein n=1 Tax=Papaver somniferum TaxID=3469 RepID=A0A4Y7IU97_PAPSO|nr:hypothetical protein C5167_019803 [Papaver somniferum]